MIAVLDDDPTGTQAVEDTPVVLDWSPDVLRRLPEQSLHVVTNTRALSAASAYTVTREVAAAVMQRFPRARIVLRGDSTLRAHLREEYEAVRDVVFPGLTPRLLLVPALPAAGRVTVGGVHLLERSGRRMPLHQTEYATDGEFAYRSSRLLEWAEERSHGLFPAANGSEVPLAELRARGGAAVHEALAASTAHGGAAVCAPDAETCADLVAIADGLRAAQAAGLPVIVRSAPTFAGVLGSTLAATLLPMPRARSLLVVCGSYVPQTTRQLACLLATRPGALVELDLSRLLGGERDRELARAAQAARESLARERIAVVATPRTRSAAADDPEAAGLISAGLVVLTQLLASQSELVLFKGGITSAVCIRDGLGAQLATVEGPVAPGVALWRLEDGRRCFVFPGNVGRDETLAGIVAEVLA
jgi:uncharacterized protein YgbK (DUF1537 family)